MTPKSPPILVLDHLCFDLFVTMLFSCVKLVCKPVWIFSLLFQKARNKISDIFFSGCEKVETFSWNFKPIALNFEWDENEPKCLCESGSTNKTRAQHSYKPFQTKLNWLIFVFTLIYTYCYIWNKYNFIPSKTKGMPLYICITSIFYPFKIEFFLSYICVLNSLN